MKRVSLVAVVLLTCLMALSAQSAPAEDQTSAVLAQAPPASVDQLPAQPSLALLLIGLGGLAFAGTTRPRANEPVPRTHDRRRRRRVRLQARAAAALSVLLPWSAGATPILSEVFFDATGGDDQKEWVELYNDGAVAIDLAGYSLGWGGADYTTGTLQLSGTIAPGQYFVIGGPISDATNGNPTFDLSVDFAPDIENSGIFTAADGIALFDVTAVSITAATIPIDALIYSGAFFSANWNNLMDETGSPGAVDFSIPLFGTGFSAEFDGVSWLQQGTPTPGNGPFATPEPSTALNLLLGLALLSGWRRRASTAAITARLAA